MIQSVIHSEAEFDKIAAMLKDSIFSRDEVIGSLRKRIEEISDENYKDEKLAEMKAEVEKLRDEIKHGFPIGENRAEDIKLWKRKHDKHEHNNAKGYHGAAGGGYVYDFYPTGIGNFYTVICPICRKRAYDYAYEGTIHTPGFGKPQTVEIKFNSQKFREYMDEHDGQYEWSDV